MPIDSTLTLRALPPGSMRYFAWLFTAPEHRDVLAGVFVIESELHDSAQAAHEVAHVRLQWWREEIERLSAGKAQHPATQALQTAATPQRKIDWQLLHQAQFSAAQELACATYETDAELTQYLQAGLGSLCQFAVTVMHDNATAEVAAAAMKLGAFIRQVEILRDLRHDLHHGRLYLPLQVLDRHDISYETLQASTWSDAFVELLSSRIRAHLADYATLKQGLLHEERSQLRPLLVLAEQHATLLAHIAANPQQHTRTRAELSALRKLWTAWCAARQA